MMWNPKSGTKVMIAMVCGDMVHADYTYSLMQMYGQSLLSGVVCGVTLIKSTLIDWGRNTAVREALKNECSHLLFVDSDMAFMPDALNRLLAHNKPIVGVTYCTRRAPFVLVHHNLEGEVRALADASVYKVASLPTGLMLIETSVFKRLDDPWFVADVRQQQGEDIYFCHTARDAGYDIWLDVELSKNVRHCGLHYYALTDAKPADLEGHYL